MGYDLGGFVIPGFENLFKEGPHREEKRFDLGLKRGKKEWKLNFSTICEQCYWTLYEYNQSSKMHLASGYWLTTFIPWSSFVKLQTDWPNSIGKSSDENGKRELSVKSKRLWGTMMNLCCIIPVGKT